jgi:hypothetical protein
MKSGKPQSFLKFGCFSLVATNDDPSTVVPVKSLDPPSVGKVSSDNPPEGFVVSVFVVGRWKNLTDMVSLNVFGTDPFLGCEESLAWASNPVLSSGKEGVVVSRDNSRTALSIHSPERSSCFRHCGIDSPPLASMGKHLISNNDFFDGPIPLLGEDKRSFGKAWEARSIDVHQSSKLVEREGFSVRMERNASVEEARFRFRKTVLYCKGFDFTSSDCDKTRAKNSPEANVNASVPVAV